MVNQFIFRIINLMTNESWQKILLSPLPLVKKETFWEKTFLSGASKMKGWEEDSQTSFANQFLTQSLPRHFSPNPYKFI